MQKHESQSSESSVHHKGRAFLLLHPLMTFVQSQPFARNFKHFQTVARIDSSATLVNKIVRSTQPSDKIKADETAHFYTRRYTNKTFCISLRIVNYVSLYINELKCSGMISHCNSGRAEDMK